MANQVLLVGGYKSTGKSELTNFIARQFTNLQTPVPTGQKGKDYLYLQEWPDNNGNTVRIVVNTASDDKASAIAFDNFLANNHCDIIITAIRSFGINRQRILNIVSKHTTQNSFLLEIPLARIHGKLAFNSLNWYTQTREVLAKHILRLPPFNLKI